jgi:thymidylate synthase
MEDKNQNSIRGEGKIPVISIEADCLAEAAHKAIIACHDYGTRVETPKHKPGMTLGYDADITVRVNNPQAEPKIYFPGMHDTPIGVMQYILEVTHGIHNHWKKCEEHPEWWGYTYNERLVDQLPFVFQRIKADWDKKKKITGRDYQFTTWRPGEDIVLEQEDPPCLQICQTRFLENDKGEIVMNYLSHWRSRDELKAWNQNNVGQIKLMELLAKKVSNLIEQPIKLGAYIDHCSSLHLYGLYIDRDGLEKQIEQMKHDGWEQKSMALDDYFNLVGGKTQTQLKRIIHGQSIAEKMGYGLNQSEDTLAQIGIDVEKFPYPKEWDSWPESWDAKPNPKMLARVY